MTLIFINIYINNPTSTVSSDSANITNMLNAYKKGNYKTAEKYAKKIKNTKYDASESKMTGAMTKAFANVLLNADEDYLFDGVFFVDMQLHMFINIKMAKLHMLGNLDMDILLYQTILVIKD